MAKPVAIVTGSSGGIGKEAAAELAKKGYHVVYACRNQSKAEEAIAYAKKVSSGAETTFLQLDTGKMKSVKAFATAFLAKFDRLDVLVNNAGSGYFKKDERTTEDNLEAFFATNYLGAFLLTRLLTDILKKSNGRVVNVTSIEHWDGKYDFEKQIFQRCGVQGVAVNPGGVFSGIWWYMRGFKAKVWNLVAPLFLLNTKQGAATIVHGATAEDLPREKPVYLSPYKARSWFPYYSDLLGFFNGSTMRVGCPKAYNEDAWKKLWDFSEEQIKPYL